ncbi:MAG TPA: glycosyltransferase family 4 protein [Candidatus Limnocylindrales bacterium]|nr:glycosyltransferase family 4 protein [Candidatus Limnocylindrales bacterium]
MPDRRYKVLFVCGHPVQYMSPLLRRMAQHPQLEISTVYCRLRGATAGIDPEFGAKIQWDIPLLDGYTWVEIPNKGTDSEGVWGLYNPGLWKFVRTGNFDAVFCLTGYIRASFWITYFACKLSLSAFLFGTDATSLAPRDSSKWKRPVKRLFWPLLYRLATQVVVPSSGTLNLMHSLGIPDERVTRVPFVVDNDWWIAHSAQVDRNSVRGSWGAGPNTSVVLFCAKLQPWKRPFDLLQAFAQADVPDSLLVFAGEGPLRESLQSESNRLGCSHRVRFLGFVNQSQLPACYTAADLLVLPSDYEPFGLVVNEAMLCGCMAAASDQVGAARDLIAPVDPSFIYPCGDIGSLAALLRRAFSDPHKLAKLRAAARERMTTWSPREYIAATLEAVERAVSHLRPIA